MTHEKNIYRSTAWIYEIEHGTNAPMPDVPFYHAGYARGRHNANIR